jgi:hypothetical protein
MPPPTVPANAAPRAVAPPREPAPLADDRLAIYRVADIAAGTAELPLADVDHPVAGLVGDHPIEPAVDDHSFVDSPTVEPAVDPIRGAIAAPPNAPSARWEAPTTKAVQRHGGAGRYPALRWPPDAPEATRSSPVIEPRDQAIQFSQYVPAPIQTVVANDSPQQSTELIVQRAADEPATISAPVTTDPAAAPGASGGVTPGQPAGSNSPTEIDHLVRRLYDPLVRRLKAELQLDRERAGHSLDLWH